MSDGKLSSTYANYMNVFGNDLVCMSPFTIQMYKLLARTSSMNRKKTWCGTRVLVCSFCIYNTSHKNCL